MNQPTIASSIELTAHEGDSIETLKLFVEVAKMTQKGTSDRKQMIGLCVKHCMLISFPPMISEPLFTPEQLSSIREP
jgi:hypothetical protein